MDPDEKKMELCSTNVSKHTRESMRGGFVRREEHGGIETHSQNTLAWRCGPSKRSNNKLRVSIFQITLTNLVSVDERLVYRPHPDNPEV